MTWNTGVFWPAMKRAGMLQAAVYQPLAGDTVTLDVSLARPDALLLGEMVKVTQHQIEYETASMPDLCDGETISIGTDRYLVRGTPEKKGDGSFSTAEVIKS